MGKLKIPNKFGVAPNELLNSTNLSFKAKGIYTFLQSKPDGWKFSVSRIAQQSVEGERAVRSGLQELEKEGWLERVPTRGKNGFTGYDYILQNVSLQNVSLQNVRTRNVSTQNRLTLSKKDNSKKDIVKKSKNNNVQNKILNLSSFDFEMAKKLADYIIANNPLYSKKEFVYNKEKWANEFRLMRERDKLTEEQIEFLVDWSQNHPFWKTNILSPSKLRKQTPRLIVQAKEEHQRGGGGIIDLNKI